MTAKEVERFKDIMQRLAYEEPVCVTEGTPFELNGVTLSKEDYEFISPFLYGEFEHRYTFGGASFKITGHLCEGLVRITSADGVETVTIDTTTHRQEYALLALNTWALKNLPMPKSREECHEDI